MSRPLLLAPLAGAVLAALASSAAAAPAPAPAPAPSPQELDRVEVHGQAVSRATSPKLTEPLRDTPQTVTVIERKTIDDQNLLSLQDILSTLPGITFGAGEGGGGYGDKINLRGFDATNDITVDGVRDSGLYSRTDPFNLEAIEVFNGANSVYSGAGSVGGTINLVSKMAVGSEFNRFSAGIGSDDYARVTADSNLLLGESAALRLNAMAHRNDVPGRDFETEERWGFAPSITLGLGSDTTWSLGYVHQEDDNVPLYGVPFYNGAPVPGIDDSTYYGYRNLDGQEVDYDAITSIVRHAFSDTASLRNLTRWQQVEQVSRASAPQGTYCLASGLQPSGAPCPATVQPGFYQPSGPRGYVRDSVNRTFYNQTDLTFDFSTGPVEHSLVAGFSFLSEDYDLDTSSFLRTAAGAAVTPTPMDVYNPDGLYTGPINRMLTARTAGTLDNRAFYAFDTLKFSEQWMLSLGARYERNEGDTVASIVSNGVVTGANAPLENADNLFSYRAGLVYKPVEAMSLYAAYANSKTPSKASVNGSCTAANCMVDPETAVSYELGAKWDVLDGRLALTGAVFRNDRENYRVTDAGNPQNPSGIQQLDGSARVDGIALGVSGLITDQWSVFANYTHLDSEVLQGVSDAQAAQGLDYARGDSLLNVPRNAFSFWTTYDVNPRWQLGLGSTYQGSFYLTQHSATNPDGPLVTTDSYWVHRAMVAFRVNRGLRLQLNVNNLSDTRYFTNIRNNGWAMPGEARSVVLTANFAF